MDFAFAKRMKVLENIKKEQLMQPNMDLLQKTH
jgi:hypothetical protein